MKLISLRSESVISVKANEVFNILLCHNNRHVLIILTVEVLHPLRQGWTFRLKLQLAQPHFNRLLWYIVIVYFQHSFEFGCSCFQGLRYLFVLYTLKEAVKGVVDEGDFGEIV